MKKITQYIDRPASILTGKNIPEHLHTFKDFPVFMGCTDTPIEDDIVADMIWGIDPETGMVQLEKLLPLDILYLNQHNDGIGAVWQEHFRSFAAFLATHALRGPILEIGGAHDIIATQYLAQHPSDPWTIIEPHPEQVQDPRIRVIKEWFEDATVLPEQYGTIVHSHVLEHMYDPVGFIHQVYAKISEGGRMIFTFPNMEPMLKKHFTNCLNFEHTAFLTEYFVDYIVTTAGFHIIAKEYFGDPHSIFYALEKRAVVPIVPPLENKYVAYKKIFEEFISYHTQLVEELNQKIADTSSPVYLFGAHIFSQYLIQFGLDTSHIVGVLDNSPLKQGKRLYATSLIVESPKILKGKGRISVILKAGIYNDEIKKDIIENINNEVEFY